MNLNGSRIRKNIHGLLCLIVVIVIIVAGLWPFNFSPENKVRWLQNQNGVQFYGQAMIFTQLPAPYPLYPYSVELWLQPATESSSHIGHIFSILGEQGSETFFVGQWRSHLILGKGIHGKTTYREMGTRDVLKKGDKRFVTITSGVDGTNIYVGGILLKSSPRFQLFSMNEKPSGRIVSGNSPTGGEYWTGNLLSLAIYDRVLTGEEISQHFHGSKKSGEEGPVSFYLFDEHSGTLAHDSVGDHHLLIPSRFEVLQKTILVPPWKDFSLSRSYFMDILTNILGFIPFGFFFSAFLCLKKPLSTYRILLISVLLAGCISLSIELIQVYLPTRSSQLTDVITNISGAALGVILFNFYQRRPIQYLLGIKSIKSNP
jgi:VanZ family protein